MIKKYLKKGFVYYLLASLLITGIFLYYIQGDSIIDRIDGWGWLFFVTSCISHSALLTLALLLVFYLPLVLIRRHNIAAILFVGSVSLLTVISFVNMQVYKIYRFHINGFILNMLTGPNAADIFQFDSALYFREGLMLIFLIVLCIVLWFVANKLAKLMHKVLVCSFIIFIIAITLIANGLHVYGVFVVKPSIMLTSRLVPYYFPLAMNDLLIDMGIERHVVDDNVDISFGDLQYPLNPLTFTSSDSTKTNIIFILIDSWSKRSLTEETMPNLWSMSMQENYYANHISCSNGTRSSVFGLFTGLQPYYWPSFEASHTSPLLIDRLLSLGYDFRSYPSATLDSPPFSTVLFHEVPNLRTETLGNSPYQRDSVIAADFVKDIPALAKRNCPFFAFVFFDMPHGLTYPVDKPKYFTPAWDYADYSILNNDTPVEPFWNLYRNLCHATDQLIGDVINQLKACNLYDNSLIIITGDHAQEFNENHKNYWGHSGNFSQYQIGVPMIVHKPGFEAPIKFFHRTTHYDIVPTIMHDYLGVSSPLEYYCVGKTLDDESPRLWHFLGNELQYAFLLEKDTILTKEGDGWIEVTDAAMNPIDNYHINPKKFERVVNDLNRFFKK